MPDGLRASFPTKDAAGNYVPNPFAEQLDFFRQKLNLPTDRWDDIMRGAHDRAFIVAGAAKADLLDDLRAAVDKAIEQGNGYDVFHKDFKAIVAKHGWTGWTGEGTKAGEAWRTRVIYQTNMATSYAAGRYKQLTDPDFLTLRPYWRYKHADWVANPRVQHVAWNDLVLPHDHPFWQTHFPPNGWGCHCRVTPVDATEYEKAQAAGKAEPPAGWDSIDAKNGAPKGVSRGFDYAPGANVGTPLRDLINEKLLKLPPELAKALASDVATIPVEATAPKLMLPDARTTKEAAELAVKYDLADFADYSGAAPEVANAWNRSLFDHLQEFPALRARQKFVGSCQAQFSRWREIEIDRFIQRLRAANPHIDPAHDWRPLAEKYVKPKKVGGAVWAHSWSQPDVSGIAVNKKWGGAVAEFKASLKRNVETNWHPPGCDTVRSVVDHELGHQLDDLLRLSVDAEVLAVYNEAKGKGIAREVSGYAAKNIAEFIAEAWAESLNAASPRTVAVRIADIVRARYRANHP